METNSRSAREASTRERGQGIVEFAVIFPIFAILLFMVIDGGLLMGRYNNANGAAAEGARLAAVGADEDVVRSAVDGQLHGALDTTSAANCDGGSGDAVCIKYIEGPEDQDAGDVGSLVKVYVRYEYEFLTPLPNFMGGGDWTIEACSIERVERHVSSPADDDVPDDC